MPHERRLSAPYRPCVLRTYATVLVCQGLPRVVRKPSASSCAAIWARVSPCAWRACMRRKARSTSGGGGASWGGRCAGCRAGCRWLLRGRFFSKIRFDRVADDVCQIPAWADRGCQYGRKADSNAGWGHSRASGRRGHLHPFLVMLQYNYVLLGSSQARNTSSRTCKRRRCVWLR